MSKDLNLLNNLTEFNFDSGYDAESMRKEASLLYAKVNLKCLWQTEFQNRFRTIAVEYQNFRHDLLKRLTEEVSKSDAILNELRVIIDEQLKSQWEAFTALPVTNESCLLSGSPLNSNNDESQPLQEYLENVNLDDLFPDIYDILREDLGPEFNDVCSSLNETLQNIRVNDTATSSNKEEEINKDAQKGISDFASDPKTSQETLADRSNHAFESSIPNSRAIPISSTPLYSEEALFVPNVSSINMSTSSWDSKASTLEKSSSHERVKGTSSSPTNDFKSADAVDSVEGEKSNKRKANIDEEKENGLNYKCTSMLRSHCWNEGDDGNNVKIWGAKFKPDSSKGCQYAATCGGQVVAFLDCKSGETIKKYKDLNRKEEFLCLDWVTIDKSFYGGRTKLNLIAAGSKQREILLLNYDKVNDFKKFNAHNDSINCIKFDSNKPSRLMSGSYDKRINVWQMEINSPVRGIKVRLMHKVDSYNKLLSLEYSSPFQTVLAGGESGLFFWKLNCSSLTTATIDLPKQSPRKGRSKKMIDGLALLDGRENYFAFRLTDRIIIANLKKMIKHMVENQEVTNIPLEIVAQCRFFDLESYLYLSIRGNLLATGTSSGQVWLYEITDDILTEGNELTLIEPVANLDIINYKKFEMPKRKKNTDIIVNCVDVSANGKYVIGGTDCNFTCIWTKESSSRLLVNNHYKKVKIISPKSETKPTQPRLKNTLGSFVHRRL